MRKILIVEDDPAIAKALAMFLVESDEPMPFQRMARPFGNGRFEVATASSLAECLKSLKRGDVDAVVLDLNLPDSSGVVTLETVTNATASPVVVLTGEPDRREECLAKGAAAYAIKGDVDRQEFASIVRRAIATRGAREGIKEAKACISQLRKMGV